MYKCCECTGVVNVEVLYFECTGVVNVQVLCCECTGVVL
jgi:hypothetical protein